MQNTLKDKIKALNNLNTAIIELLSTSKEENAAEDLAKEIEESDNNIAEMQKVLLAKRESETVVKVKWYQMIH